MPGRAILWLVNILIYLRHPGWVKKFRRRLGYWPRVALPRTVNEKVFWRKVFDRNPAYRIYSDKLAVRAYIASRCPDLAMPEFVWIGDAAADIPDAYLTPNFVVKTNNGSSRNIFFDHDGPNRTTVIAHVSAWLAEPYGVRAGQWSYAHVPPVVMVERMVCDRDDPSLIDVSCFVMKGRTHVVFVRTNVKRANTRRAAFDRDGNRLALPIAVTKHGESIMPLPDTFRLPDNFPRLLAQAEKIGAEDDFIRVDFLCVGEQLYFSECTVFPNAGYSANTEPLDGRIAPHWDLRDSWFMRHQPGGAVGLYARALRQRLAT